MSCIRLRISFICHRSVYHFRIRTHKRKSVFVPKDYVPSTDSSTDTSLRCPSPECSTGSSRLVSYSSPSTGITTYTLAVHVILRRRMTCRPSSADGLVDGEYVCSAHCLPVAGLAEGIAAFCGVTFAVCGHHGGRRDFPSILYCTLTCSSTPASMWCGTGAHIFA